MTGKPRRKKGETLAHYRGRVKEWETKFLDEAHGIKEQKIKIMDPFTIKCFSCGLYVPEMPRNTWGQCSRDPIWLRVNDNHYCGSWRAPK